MATPTEMKDFLRVIASVAPPRNKVVDQVATWWAIEWVLDRADLDVNADRAAFVQILTALMQDKNSEEYCLAVMSEYHDVMMMPLDFLEIREIMRERVEAEKKAMGMK